MKMLRRIVLSHCRTWKETQAILRNKTPKTQYVIFSPFGTCSRKYSTNETQYKSLHEMPGPKPVLPWFGTSWLYSWIGPYTKDDMVLKAKEELFIKYGDMYKERMRGVWLVNLHKPEHIEIVMRNQGKFPLRVANEANIHCRKSRPDIYKSVGLIDSNGEEWHDLRQKVAPSVLKPEAVTQFVEPLSVISDNFNNAIRGESSEKVHDIPDVKEYLYSYALDAIWTTSLGFEIGSLKSQKLEETKNLIANSMNLFLSFAKLSQSRSWWKVYPTSTFTTFCRLEDNIHRTVNRYTQQIIKKTRNEKVSGKSPVQTTLINRFLENKKFDHQDINTVIIDFIAAGIPTTSFFLCLLLHRLGQEKRLQERLQRELDAAVPDKNATITESILKRVPLLNATVQEGFRSTSIIPAIMKILPQDIICDEYKIPAYTPILCQTRVSSLSEKYFSRPKEFIADRWLRTNSEDAEILKLQREAKSNKFSLIPFGFGPRTCVGKRLAEKEILVILAKILLNFTLETEGELRLKNCFIIAPKDSVPIRFIERL